MDKIKRILPGTLLFAIYLVVFNILAFVLTDDFTGNFWCGYIFVTLSWLCLVGIEALMLWKDDRGKSIFLNAPGFLFAFLHLLVQTALSVAVMAIPNYSVKLSVCVQIVVFSIFLMLFELMEVYKSHSKNK